MLAACFHEYGNDNITWKKEKLLHILFRTEKAPEPPKKPGENPDSWTTSYADEICAIRLKAAAQVLAGEINWLINFF